MNQTNFSPEVVAREFSIKVCELFYEKKDRAEGTDLLKLSPSLQINLLVIYEIAQKWSAEMDKVRSHYFDFEKQQVQEAFIVFKNIVSRHISIKREHLEPILEQSAFRYINWILKPIEIDQLWPEIRTVEPKYIKTYSDCILKWQIEGKWEEPSDQEKQLAGKRMTEEIQQVLPQFNTYFETSPQDQPLEEIRSSIKPSKPKSINEALAQKKGLFESLTLNQKLMFQNNLFGGYQEEMKVAINTAEGLESFDKALDFLKTRFGTKYNWDFETDEVSELLELLELYFSK